LGKRNVREEAARSFAQEEMPVPGVSGGGSSSPAPEFETTKKICFDLLLDKINNCESKKHELAEERAGFYERRVKLLERSNAEKAKEIEVLEKKNEVLEKKHEDVLDLNRKEYEEARQEVTENLDAHLTCLDHYLDLFHLCNGKIMDTREHGHPGANKPHQAAGQVGL
jgi:hypothetical protein